MLLSLLYWKPRILSGSSSCIINGFNDYFLSPNYLYTDSMFWFASSHLIDRLPISYGAYDLVGSSDIDDDDDDVGFEL